MAMSYRKIPLEHLDEIRAVVHFRLKEISKSTGDSYAIRTFYCGPRPKKKTSRPASTPKAAAYAAKIGIYRNGNLVRYI